ncbi:MAG TPA: ABC transporter permease subunit [Streptosporangiaceae bacterium]|nr:ABC transporter permease subunit [Streptosporangiaceae bacterium]
MTTVATPIRLTQARVAYSEWIKLRSLRSTWWTLSIFAVTTIGIAVLLSSIAAAHVTAGKHLGFNQVTLSLYGAYLAPLTIGVLGGLAATGEYMTGMIRASLTAVPTRLPVLWAKLGVFALVGLIISEIAVFISFGIGMAILGHAGAGISLGQPGVLRTVAGTGLYLMLTGLFGLAIGAVVRNTAVAISALAGIMLVLPVVTNLLPATWTAHFARYLPSSAGQAILFVRHTSGFLAPWTGLALFAGYIAAVVAIAAVLLKRRDA